MPPETDVGDMRPLIELHQPRVLFNVSSGSSATRPPFRLNCVINPTINILTTGWCFRTFVSHVAGHCRQFSHIRELRITVFLLLAHLYTPIHHHTITRKTERDNPSLPPLQLPPPFSFPPTNYNPIGRGLGTIQLGLPKHLQYCRVKYYTIIQFEHHWRTS